ncbi:hypothetical protein D1BOALGB6SA_6379 [Olavius sp. associated proteobacterium Delta 1]|nr:hypothetical protein D1BOALGB6SA_6379 [Olavius sp. associated proteobacterium Delta 1]
MAGSLYRFITITTALLSVLLLVSVANPQDETKKNLDQKAKQRLLKREAANALYRFKLRLEKEGFYSGRVALNVWRSTAIDAGTFDEDQYKEFKTQLYEKSVNDSLKCFEEFILEENFYDANVCLQTWRMHSKELGTYDQAEYEAHKKTLAEARTAKTSGSKATENPKE